MLNTKIFTLCLASIATFWCATIHASDLTTVVNPLAPNALFESDGVAQKVLNTEDGGRLIACERAVVTGLKGAKLHGLCNSKEAQVRLYDGTFHIYVGSEPLVVQAGDASLRVVKSELIVSKVKSQWVIQAKPLSEAGSVEMIIPYVHPPVNSEAEVAVVEKTTEEPKAEEASIVQSETVVQEPKLLVLKPGVRWRLESQSIVKRANAYESKILEVRIKALFPTDKNFEKKPLLSAVEVEQESDFTVAATAAEAASLTEIEIEDVEVEVGCVEICVD